MNGRGITLLGSILLWAGVWSLLGWRGVALAAAIIATFCALVMVDWSAKDL